MKISFLCIALLFATAAPGWAAVVRLVEVTPGQYRLDAENLTGVAGLDLIIDYDSETLRLARVSAGSLLKQALFTSNPNQPGRVRIAAINNQPVNGSGTLATISGTLLKSPPLITAFNVTLINSESQPLAVRTRLVALQVNEPATAAPLSETQTASGDASSSSTGSGLHAAGNADFPAPWSTIKKKSATVEKKPDPYVSQRAPTYPQDKLTAAKSGQPAEPYVKKQQASFSAVIDRFKNHTGGRTFRELRLLFSPDETLRQQPEILLTDGTHSLEVEFIAKGGKRASQVYQNARLLEILELEDNRILLRCIPAKNALTARIFFLGTDTVLEIPLTVAPPISLAGLVVQPEETLPKLDLDGDGESNWRDDYVLVANILAQIQPGTLQKTAIGTSK